MNKSLFRNNDRFNIAPALNLGNCLFVQRKTEESPPLAAGEAISPFKWDAWQKMTPRERLEDYAIISRLALRATERDDFKRDKASFEWVRKNIFTLEALERWFRSAPDSVQYIEDRFQQKFAELILQDIEPREILERGIQGRLQMEMQFLQHADRQYWKRIIADLRRLRSAGELMPEGSPVELTAS